MSNWFPVMTLVITMLALTTLIGRGLRRFANLQPGTALLGALPGGAGEMIAMSDSIGADVRLVTVMQYGRLLAILATISVVGHFAGAPASGGQHAIASAPAYPAEPLNYLVSTIIAVIGAMTGVRFRIPAGTMIIPAILAALAGILGIPAARGLRWLWQVPIWFLVYKSGATISSAKRWRPKFGIVTRSDLSWLQPESRY